MIERICKICNKPFKAHPNIVKLGYAKYCSLTCWGIAQRNGIKTNCQECGKEFETFPSHIKRGRGKYCSKACKCKAMSKILGGKNCHFWNGGLIKRICQECNKEFNIKPHRIITGRGKYCSKACYGKALSKIKVGNTHPNWKGGKIETICQECGITFKIESSVLKSGFGKYCSRTCVYNARARSKIDMGQNNPAWKGGISFEPYCPKFTDEFKERVRAFFDYQCQMPGCEHVWQPEERKLSVHHVNFLKNSCCDPSISRLFVPLCSGKCHNKTNRNRLYWEQLFTELIMIKFNGQCYLPKED